MFDFLRTQRYLVEDGEHVELTGAGRGFMREFGIDLDALGKTRCPLCKPCLDWSERLYARGWAERQNGSRIVRFSREGKEQFMISFPI